MNATHPRTRVPGPRRARRRRPRPYLSHLPPPPPPPAPALSSPPLPLLHRVLSGLRALPDSPLQRREPSSDAALTASLASLTRRLLERDPGLGAPPEEREPSPDVVVTQELPIVAVLLPGGGR